MPIQIRQNIHAGAGSSPAPQNPPLGGSIYPRPLLNSLVWCPYSGRGWFTIGDPSDEETHVAQLIGPIAATQHISTALSKVYWRESATAILNEAILVLDRTNSLGQFEVNVPTTFNAGLPLTFKSSPIFDADRGLYLVGTSNSGLLEARSLTKVIANVSSATPAIGTGWSNLTDGVSIGVTGLNTHWILTAHATITSTDNHDDIGVRLYNVSSDQYIASTSTHIEHATHHVPVSLSTVVTVSGVQTINLQAISSGGNAAGDRDHFGANTHGITLKAVRI